VPEKEIPLPIRKKRENELLRKYRRFGREVYLARDRRGENQLPKN